MRRLNLTLRVAAFVALCTVGQANRQYVAYTTAQATGPVLGTISRPDFEVSAACDAPSTPDIFSLKDRL